MLSRSRIGVDLCSAYLYCSYISDGKGHYGKARRDHHHYTQVSLLLNFALEINNAIGDF